MAGHAHDSDDDIVAGINMVPFIDICLVLLIIFMVTSVQIVHAAIEVELPRAAHGTGTTAQTLAVELTRDGQVRLDGQTLTLAELHERTRALVAADPTVQAFIAADRAADYGRVVDIIDTVKGAGVRGFALNIERRAEATP
jgi:biopolymer transport protein ExbD